MAETNTGHKTKILRSDQGMEFTNGVFEEYLEKRGIQHQLSAVRSPQQNGIAERKN